MIFTTEQTMQDIRERIRAGAGRDGVTAAWLRWKADEAAARRGEYITDHPSPAASGDPHDYFSEGPYWWPDPKNPGGPYIRRDGEINPERFDHHGRALNRMIDDALILAMAAYHLGEARCTAALLPRLEAFFVSPATRMNPNMNHAQAIRGICDGRGIGIIEATGLSKLAFAMEILAAAGAEEAALDGVRGWLSEFYRWLRTSKNGLDEKHHPNNHSMWYTATTIALARYLGDGEGFASDCDYFAGMMAKQLTEDGAFRDETTRTKAFHYCCYNLSAAAAICEAAYFGGADLWNLDCGGGRSMSAAVRWIAPYFVSPYGWPFKEIGGGVGDAPAAMLAASVRLKDEAGISAAKKSLAARASWDPYRFASPAGPTVLYFG